MCSILSAVAVEGQVQPIQHLRLRAGRPLPTMMRSGFMKSATAAPSLRNSGLETTTKRMSSPRRASAPGDGVFDALGSADWDGWIC